MSAAVQPDPKTLAKSAHLRYVNDDEPGITRRRSGRGFSYFDAHGNRIRDNKTLKRIKQIVIPPAWTDVWICTTATGHIQATGRDAKGRKQYRYHERWRDARDQTKFDRMVAFGQALPTIREHGSGRSSASTICRREKVLAAVVQLLGTTFIRVGNEEYAREQQLVRADDAPRRARRDLTARASTLNFAARAARNTPSTSKIGGWRGSSNAVRTCRDSIYFSTTTKTETIHAVTSSDVNDYLREISGEDFTAKDFRTWGGTTRAAAGIGGFRPMRGRSAGAKERPRDDQGGRGAVGQHGCCLPEILHSSRRDRLLSERQISPTSSTRKRSIPKKRQ